MFLRIIAIILFLAWMVWWWTSAPKQDRSEKRKRSGIYIISKYANFGISFLIAFQLLGFKIFPIKNFSIIFGVLGFSIFLIGILISSLARITLGSSWTPGYNYQIKPNQLLITNGIYKYIRHPIYIGILLAYIGADLVAESYLSIILLILFIPIYRQAKLEEGILLAHFGEKYKNYMKKSKMLLPFII